ncbi:MAG: glycosyltransferase family 4 protein [Desulfovibrio sp.]|jgi:glycosyltransferase involved in cell wall biosynthesis|nr:glycosyltransferase family 4 protein [Desulfovibrio sp.]
MKIAVLGNQARAMTNFWSVLLRRMIAAGHEALCLVPETGAGEEEVWEESLAGLGARLVRYPLDRKGLHPLRDAVTLLSLWRIFRRERPDVLFAYTIKPVIYGATAAALAGVPSRDGRHVMITGLGYMFEGDSPVKKLLLQVARILYRFALGHAGAVYFQNDDDRRLFERLCILPHSIAVRQSKGTGVDVHHFTTHEPPAEPPIILFVGRLLEAKGLRELAQAAALVRTEYPQVRFQLLGPAETGPGAVPLEQVREWEEQGLVEYLGETQEVRPYLERASAVILPSWREGAPCSLMEAMSMGRAVIAADAPGSREVVRDGVNGFLTPVRDARGLANAVNRFIMEPALARRMGAAGRALMEEEFSAESVACELLRSMGAQDVVHSKASIPGQLL